MAKVKAQLRRRQMCPSLQPPNHLWRELVPVLVYLRFQYHPNLCPNLSSSCWNCL